MTHIFLEKGIGDSKESLSAAVANAFKSALKEHKFEGDHQCSMSLIITGYYFDGKRYHVQLQVLIFDYELAQEDLYELLENEHKHLLELEQEHMNQFFAAVHRIHVYNSNITNLMYSMLFNQPNLHLKNIAFISTQTFHDQFSYELGYQPELTPIWPRVHMDLADPALDNVA